MRLKDLRVYIRRNKAYGLDTTAQQVNYQERISLVFTPLVFVLLGIPFALQPLKSQSMPKSIAFCFLIVFIYLLMFRMSLSIGKSGIFPPIVAGWAPISFSHPGRDSHFQETVGPPTGIRHMFCASLSGNQCWKYSNTRMNA